MISRVLDGGHETDLVDRRGQVLNSRFILLQVNVDVHDARQGVQRFGDVAHARVTGHAADTHGGYQRLGFVRFGVFHTLMTHRPRGHYTSLWFRAPLQVFWVAGVVVVGDPGSDTHHHNP
jgi:hypothetical protein